MAGALFTEPRYLQALHVQAATERSGWQLLDDVGPITYLKSHSWGEFVFDFEFANAYQRAGLAYYPKMLCAVPFSPVTGPRLFGRTGSDLRQQCHAHSASGVHVLFLSAEERDVLATDGWHSRCDIRFVWQDRDYGDFDGFLAALNSKRRKNIRRERRKITESGFRIEWMQAADIPEYLWPRLYGLYASTYQMRGQQPYLDEACLRAWGQALPEQMLFCLAWDGDDQCLAMAMFFREADCLYGRHWGAAIDVDALHFELCYYQGIEFCLAQKLSHFDAGVQGGHRLLRGFEPVLSHSAHYFADERFHDLIGNFLAREGMAVRQHQSELLSQTAFRQD